MREDKQMENPEKNPLMISLIVEKIFDNLAVPELMIARLVCTLWHSCSQRNWDKAVKLRIKEDAEHGSPHGNIRYQRFLQRLEEEERQNDRDGGLEGEEGDFARFEDSLLEVGIQENWNMLCENIKTLELVKCTLPTVKSLHIALCVCFPNLEHMILGPVSVTHKPSKPPVEPKLSSLFPVKDEQQNLRSLTLTLFDCESFPLSWIEVLVRFPALEKLSNKGCINTERIFHAINKIRAVDPSRLNIKHLRSSVLCGDLPVAPEEHAFLMDPRIRLESLESLNLFGNNAHLQFRDLVQSHADTLRRFEFTCLPESPTDFHRLPNFQLNTLQELKFFFDYESFDALSFLQRTPNLRKLCLMHFGGKFRVPPIDLNQLPVTLKACVQLDIEDARARLALENIKLIVEWTPNLKVLKLSWLDRDRFALICERCTNLEEFHVQGSVVTSAELLGLDDEQMKSFDLNAGSRPITVPKANITCLTKLKILTMMLTPYLPVSNPILSRAVGLYGITELSELQRLRFAGFEILPNDRDYWEQMHARYPHPVDKTD